MYAELSGGASHTHDHREGRADQSDPSRHDGRPAGRVVTGRELNTHFKRDDVEALHKMLLVGNAMRQNWPDYHLWQSVKFQLRPLTTMALNYCFWIERQLDLFSDLADHLDVEGLDMTFNTDEEAFQILDIIGMYLEDIPIAVYGYQSRSRYTGQRDHWLASVINHVTGDIPHTFDPDVAQFPRAARRKGDFIGKLINVLAASTDPHHHQLAAVVAYINHSIGVDIVDWSRRAIEESGMQARAHEWQLPNYIDRVRGNQLFGALIESLYLSLSQELAFNPDATLDFILPLYGAMAVVRSRYSDDPESKALVNLLFAPDDSDVESLYEIIFPEDPANAQEYFSRANEWLGNAEPYEKPVIRISLD